MSNFVFNVLYKTPIGFIVALGLFFIGQAIFHFVKGDSKLKKILKEAFALLIWFILYEFFIILLCQYLGPILFEIIRSIPVLIIILNIANWFAGGFEVVFFILIYSAAGFIPGVITNFIFKGERHFSVIIICIVWSLLAILIALPNVIHSGSWQYIAYYIALLGGVLVGLTER